MDATMYDTILITLDATPTDRAIIDHVKKLATLMKSQIVLLHIATGVPAQYYGANAAGEEVSKDNDYLRQITAEFITAGLSARCVLGFGDPVKEIVKWINENRCDLVAMSTHGHKIVKDLLLGTTANRVQHAISVPVLLLRAK